LPVLATPRTLEVKPSKHCCMEALLGRRRFARLRLANVREVPPSAEKVAEDVASIVV